MFVAGKGGFDARYPQRALAAGRRVLVPHFADAPQKARFRLRELLLRDLSELQPHLRGQQLLAKHRVVGELGVHRLGQLVEDEPDAAEKEAVDEDHSPSRALSSFSRMFTKL